MVCNQRVGGGGLPPCLRRLNGLAPIRLKAVFFFLFSDILWKEASRLAMLEVDANCCWKWITNRCSAICSMFWHSFSSEMAPCCWGNAGRDRKQSLIHLCKILVDICRHGMRMNGFSKLTMNHKKNLLLKSTNYAAFIGHCHSQYIFWSEQMKSVDVHEIHGNRPCIGAGCGRLGSSHYGMAYHPSSALETPHQFSVLGGKKSTSQHQKTMGRILWRKLSRNREYRKPYNLIELDCGVCECKVKKCRWSKHILTTKRLQNLEVKSWNGF